MAKSLVILTGVIGVALVAGGGYWVKDRHGEDPSVAAENTLDADAAQTMDDAEDDYYLECRENLFRWYDSPSFQLQIVQEGQEGYITACKSIIEARDLGTDAEIEDCEHLLSTWNPSANRGTKTQVTTERLQYCENLLSR
ncbi:hypothetical protein [Paracoccus methylarcula]|uniref:Uncharacterized protein n=1 Tax=Paracoccus methylarcula TaxID=72022 RepID=A0A3R7NDT0_9RHOB|nr:hypothetical protein [Paracoccus methylarcula]RNF35771.1 hypothetical protein A7A09_005170 [Paracoccus methylarcula]